MKKVLRQGKYDNKVKIKRIMNEENSKYYGKDNDKNIS